MLYFDSSAWVSRYLPEEGRLDVIAAVVAAHRGAIVRNRIVQIETERSLRVRSRSEAVREHRMAEFRSDFEDAFDLQIDDELYEDARRIVRRAPVRTLDALHIAAVRRLGRRGILFTFDQRQADAARACGVVVAGA